MPMPVGELLMASGELTDHTISILGPHQLRNQFDFGASRARGRLFTGAAARFERHVDPRDEEEIPRPRLNSAGAWRKNIRDGVSHTAEPQFVDSVALLEQIDDVERATSVPLT